MCGRRVPPAGPYACMGLIAIIVRDIAGREFLRMRPGVTAEWIDGDEGPRYRATTKVRFSAARQNIGVTVLFRRTRHLPGAVGDSPPLWCPCSHGGHENRLTAETMGT